MITLLRLAKPSDDHVKAAQFRANYDHLMDVVLTMADYPSITSPLVLSYHYYGTVRNITFSNMIYAFEAAEELRAYGKGAPISITFNGIIIWTHVWEKMGEYYNVADIAFRIMDVINEHKRRHSVQQGVSAPKYYFSRSVVQDRISEMLKEINGE